ncbi:PIF1-like helicase domain-containing protein [Pochonia chlamydosporia 170]|uniref:ATP-dependent DNA helicase n=1 Tax=Pochonia chlamydosporia 170 TaxID=1380566 RepID=A0A219ANB4_METCM|nr:PIF1-like helicase domain-containing protein [Pochonia chlamydosporia 170]OWT42243.1 PIF1-like helicase domain-containing protein [Pochonia chlamydosporia 170]
MASARHQDEARQDDECCCSSSGVASEWVTDCSWDILDLDAGGPVGAALSSRESPTQAHTVVPIDTQRANPSSEEHAESQRVAGNSTKPHTKQRDPGALTGESLNNPEPALCQEQQDLVDLIASGRNVFYTGSAGCGKSTVLKAALLRLQAIGLVVHVLAPTGRAALQVNGVSTWSYMGWTPDHHKLPIEKLISSAFREHVRRRLKSTDVLIIDEISMVENHHLERMNICMKEARRWKQDEPAPFGGAQVVVTGDFCQLPPVKPFQYCVVCGQDMKADDYETEFNCRANHGPFREHEKWAFMSKAWEECKFAYVELKQIHRQNDEHFIKMLQKCRLGIPFSQDETVTLVDHPCNVTNATRLFSTRAEVAKVNIESFNRLRTPIVTYQALDGFVWHHAEHPHLEHCNDRFTDGSLVALKDHRLERQVQLRVGHTGPTGHSPDPPTIHGDYAALKERQVQRFTSGQKQRVWPRVLFHNGQRRTIYADCTVNSVGNREPYSLLHRTQIPLVAAWAMSIHKSQGTTLDRVIVDVTRAFEEGQVYVALSRATSLHGLKVKGNPDGLSVGRGGNADVQRFLREKFGARLPQLQP